ncbi:hypothetical protein N9D63_01860 [Opitutales bacterium]|nr:hypothetical protein [Opitutales bacterium]
MGSAHDAHDWIATPPRARNDKKRVREDYPVNELQPERFRYSEHMFLIPPAHHMLSLRGGRQPDAAIQPNHGQHLPHPGLDCHAHKGSQ